MWHCASMADGAPDERPSLEMPSLSLRRRRDARDRQDAAQSTEQAPRVAVAGLPAAGLTGAVVGGLAVLLAWLAGVGCEAVRGTPACGGRPGLLVLVVVLALLAWAGSLLLRVLGVPHAGSTSVLAVGLLAVVVLVLLLDSLDEWWALVSVPLASALSYGGAWWVTTAGGEPDDTSARASYDVR